MDDPFLLFMARVLLLGAVGVVLIVGLGQFGVIEAMGQVAAGFLGIGLGVFALLVAFVWTLGS